MSLRLVCAECGEPVGERAGAVAGCEECGSRMTEARPSPAAVAPHPTCADCLDRDNPEHQRILDALLEATIPEQVARWRAIAEELDALAVEAADVAANEESEEAIAAEERVRELCVLELAALGCADAASRGSSTTGEPVVLDRILHMVGLEAVAACAVHDGLAGYACGQFTAGKP